LFVLAYINEIYSVLLNLSRSRNYVGRMSNGWKAEGKEIAFEGMLLLTLAKAAI
jgi:hypothetical protein